MPERIPEPGVPQPGVPEPGVPEPGVPQPGAPQPGAPQPGVPRSLLAEADRERIAALLREQYALGRLELDELRRRVGIVLAAEYADEAAATLADLPPLPGGPAGAGAGGPAGAAGGPAGAAGGPPGGAGGLPPGQRRRHAQTAAPGPGWTPTPERFRDPSTKKIMRVWIDPADQSRHYVPDDTA